MKTKYSAIIAVVLVLTLALGVLGACDGQEQSLDGMVIVTFELNGGVLNTGSANIQDQVYHGYQPGSRVIDISNYKNYKLSKSGFVFDGWYTDEECTKPWNFDIDRANNNVTLYAKWETEIVYRYVVYLVEDGTTTELGSYSVQEGQTFDDVIGYGKNLRSRNRTFLGYYSDLELTEAWDDSFTHPGGEASTDIPVYVDSMEGVWQFVNSYETLLAALRTTDGIYLTDNVDCGGNTIKFGNSNGVFNRVLQGNNYRISNLAIANLGSSRRPAYAIFDKLGADAKILDVTFDNVKFVLTNDNNDFRELKLAALAIEAETAQRSDANGQQVTYGAVISNVTVSGTYQDFLQDGPDYKRPTAEQVATMFGNAIFDYDATVVTVTEFNSSFTLVQ